MLEASALRVGNKFKSSFGNIETVLSIIDNTDKGKIKVCADCPDNVPHFKSEQHRLMYSHLILCEENGNQYKPCEIEGEPLTEEWLVSLGFNKHLSYWIETSEGKQLSVAWNDVGVWYAFFRNINKGKADDLVCLRSDLKFVHELQNLFFFISGKELIIKK